MKLQHTYNGLRTRGTSRSALLYIGGVTLAVVTFALSAHLYEQRESAIQAAQYAAVRSAITGTTSGDHIMGVVDDQGEIGDALPITNSPGAICMPAAQLQAMQAELNRLRQQTNTNTGTNTNTQNTVDIPLITDLTNGIADNLGTLLDEQDLNDYSPLDIPEIVDFGTLPEVPSLLDRVLGGAGGMCAAALDFLANTAPNLDDDVLNSMSLPELVEINRLLESVVSSDTPLPDQPRLPTNIDDWRRTFEPLLESMLGENAPIEIANLVEESVNFGGGYPRCTEDDVPVPANNSNAPPELRNLTCERGLQQIKRVAQTYQYEASYACVRYGGRRPDEWVVIPQATRSRDASAADEAFVRALYARPGVAAVWQVHTHPAALGTPNPPSVADVLIAANKTPTYPSHITTRYFAVDPAIIWEYGPGSSAAGRDRAFDEFLTNPTVVQEMARRALMRSIQGPNDGSAAQDVGEIFAQALRGELGAELQRLARRLAPEDILIDVAGLAFADFAPECVEQFCGTATKDAYCSQKMIEFHRLWGFDSRRFEDTLPDPRL